MVVRKGREMEIERWGMGMGDEWEVLVACLY